MINIIKKIYFIAGVYGLLVLFPLYFMENKVGIDTPPPVNHPEFYYGFIGVALAWQFLFLTLSKDPLKYRPMMLPAILEKASYSLATVVLFLLGRITTITLITGLCDMVLMILFIFSYIKTKDALTN